MQSIEVYIYRVHIHTETWGCFAMADNNEWKTTFES